MLALTLYISGIRSKVTKFQEAGWSWPLYSSFLRVKKETLDEIFVTTCMVASACYGKKTVN